MKLELWMVEKRASECFDGILIEEKETISRKGSLRYIR